MRCVMPHANLEIRSDGSFGPCCLNFRVYRDADGRPFNMATHSIADVWDSADRREYARLLDEAPHQDCRQCWDIEAGGGRSKRMIENQNRRPGTYGPSGLDIKFSNVCNLKCVICGPYNSNQWYDDWVAIKGHRFDGRGYRWIDDERTLDDIVGAAMGCDVLEFYGGEPLLIKQHLGMLERCIASGTSTRQEIRMNTNGTVPLTARHIDAYSRFKSVQISWSIDSSDRSEFEYQRFQADFQRVLDNFDGARASTSPNVMHNITHTISAMNVLSLPDMLEFVRARPDVQLHLNILANPIMLHWTRVPLAAVSKVLSGCSTEGIRLNGSGPELLLAMPGEELPSDDLVKYLDKLDSLRGTSWRSSLLRLAGVL